MNSFMKRIKQLKKRLNIVTPLSVTLIYMDGTERTMDDDAAFDELCVRKDVKEVRCAAEDLRLLLEAMLPGFDCGSDWEDDSWMIEEGLI